MRIRKLSIFSSSLLSLSLLREEKNREKERELERERERYSFFLSFFLLVGVYPPDVIGHLYLTGASLSLSVLFRFWIASLLAPSFLNLLSNSNDDDDGGGGGLILGESLELKDIYFLFYVFLLRLLLRLRLLIFLI